MKTDNIKIPIVVSKIKARLVLEIEPKVKVNGKIARIITTSDTNIELIQGNLDEIIDLIKKLLKTKKDYLEITSIPCSVDCDINSNPESDHKRLEKEGKCNKFMDKIYHHCGR